MTLDKCWGICRFKRVVTNFHPTTQKLRQCVHLYFHKNIVYTSLPKVPKAIDEMVIMTYRDSIPSAFISNGYFLFFAFLDFFYRYMTCMNLVLLQVKINIYD